MTPIPDHVAFGDPARQPRCAQGGPEIANLFTAGDADSIRAAKRVCYSCPLGPLWPDDVCASYRRSRPDISCGAVYGGRWFEGELGMSHV